MDNKTVHEALRNDATYRVYLSLHATQAAYSRKTLRVVLSELMYADPLAWRAVGITRAALDAFYEAGKKRIKGIQRAHLTDRKTMVEHILDRAEPLSQDALFYWRSTDRSVIALTGENLKNSLGDWIPFANENAQYFPPAPIGFKFRHAIEGDLGRKLIKIGAGGWRGSVCGLASPNAVSARLRPFACRWRHDQRSAVRCMAGHGRLRS